MYLRGSCGRVRLRRGGGGAALCCGGGLGIFMDPLDVAHEIRAPLRLQLAVVALVDLGQMYLADVITEIPEKAEKCNSSIECYPSVGTTRG